jgi:hypothetical protein
MSSSTRPGSITNSRHMKKGKAASNSNSNPNLLTQHQQQQLEHDSLPGKNELYWECLSLSCREGNCLSFLVFVETLCMNKNVKESKRDQFLNFSFLLYYYPSRDKNKNEMD